MKNFKKKCLSSIVLGSLVFTGFGCNGKMYTPAKNCLREDLFCETHSENQKPYNDFDIVYFNFISYVHK